MTWQYASTNTLIVLVGVVLATYASHVLNTLRKEVHDAKRYGQYQLVSKLGSGGMGDVFLAEHVLLKRPSALKLIRAEVRADPTALARFEREVMATASLTHPHTIEIFDYGHTDDGTFYYVMEYLPGLGLDQLLAEFGPLPPGRRDLSLAAGVQRIGRGSCGGCHSPRLKTGQSPRFGTRRFMRLCESSRFWSGQTRSTTKRGPIHGRPHDQWNTALHGPRTCPGK